ncbi:MAG: hypothetical protein AAF974_04205 [Cyanobacteria bacterium P01_E01_bin.34]
MTSDPEKALQQVGLLCLGLTTQMYLGTASMPRESLLNKIRGALDTAEVELPPALQPDVDNIDFDKLDKLVARIIRELN